MIPQVLDKLWDAEDICTFAFKWAIEAELAYRLYELARILDAIGYVIQIVSGWRTIKEQLGTVGGADPDISTHTSCPATGADMQIIGYNKTSTPTHIRKVFGAAAEKAGLRWGGGSVLDANRVPTDWNHVDMGPRNK